MGRTTDAGTSFVTVVVEAKEPLSDSSLGWKLLRTALLEQKRGLLLGVMVGVFWAAGKVSVPQLTKMGIDRGI